MDETFIFNCPQCGHPVEAPAEAAGMEAECPDCNAAIVVPEPPKAARPAAPAASAPAAEDDKNKTVKIELPDIENLRMAPKRNITIKRNR